jgi:hypothetical protein
LLDHPKTKKELGREGPKTDIRLPQNPFPVHFPVQDKEILQGLLLVLFFYGRVTLLSVYDRKEGENRAQILSPLMGVKVSYEVGLKSTWPMEEDGATVCM